MAGAAPIPVAIRRLPHGADLPLPAYATADSAGLDLLAAVDAALRIEPMGRALVPTGIAIALPAGYEAQVRPRSGLAARNGISVLNTPGTIDADYRGEIQVILVNFGAEPFLVTRGLRIAQLVVAPVNRVAWREESELENTTRGGGGFGSTGLKTGGLETAAKQTVKQRGGR
jgi:dUTP pyrophosphatase